MIAEAAIAGLTVCFVACLRFTRYVIERTDPFAEKRRILERKYELHCRNSRFDGESTEHSRKHAAVRNETEIQLLELADEEKLWRSL